MARKTPSVSRTHFWWIPLTALLLGACDSSDFIQIGTTTASISKDVTTVAIVEWTTDVQCQGFVKFGPTEALGLTTPVSTVKSTNHRAVLLGLKPNTTYYYRVSVGETEGGFVEGEIASVTTGYLPQDIPVITPEGKGNDQFVVTSILGTTSAVLILDPDGSVVWYYLNPEALDIYRARLSLDGKSVLFNVATVSGEPAENSAIGRIPLEGGPATMIPVPFLAHDFVEHPDGTIGAIAVANPNAPKGEVRVEKIVEVAPDGTSKDIWNSLVCFDPALVQGDDTSFGWTFANALDYDPKEDAYYISLRNFSDIVKIPRSTGTCEWILGSTAATINFAPGSSPFLHEHQFQVLENSILVFDNDGLFSESRVIEYSIDMNTMLATEIWSYRATPSVDPFVLGEPNRLEDGDTFINWAVAGQMERVSPEGIRKWKINTPLGTAFGFNTLATSLYPTP